MTSAWLSFPLAARLISAPARPLAGKHAESSSSDTGRKEQKKKKVWEEQLEPPIHQRLSAVFALTLRRLIASLRLL
ncbi:Hypothetical predicted protein [Xyrichtys novacula]|uniref:Secreted protein n=1 Tax=Xyrichtys novacula TaxID=13765 RepID=A0AAV1EMG0_XYRNO|nr:Hypothetical predicted protein [Xyrichtys novacula]